MDFEKLVVLLDLSDQKLETKVLFANFQPV
jgi:hypothetical protein